LFFHEFCRFRTTRMSAPGITAAWAVGQFVACGDLQRPVVAFHPFRRIARRLVQQEALERVPHTCETQSTRRKFRDRRGLSAKLHHQVVRHNRSEQFLLHHLHASGANVFGVQRDFHIANVVFHVVPQPVNLSRLGSIHWKRRHQVQRLAIRQGNFVQEHVQCGIVGKVGVLLAVFGAGRPAQFPGRVAVPFFHQTRLPLHRFEPRLRESKQDRVALFEHGVGDAENAVPRISQHDRTARHPLGNVAGEFRFGRIVLAVHRPDFGRERAAALQFVRHQQQRHRPDRFSVLVGGGRERCLQFGSRFERNRGSVENKRAASVEPRRCRFDQRVANAVGEEFHRLQMETLAGSRIGARRFRERPLADAFVARLVASTFLTVAANVLPSPSRCMIIIHSVTSVV